MRLAPHVRHQADAALGHGDPGALADDAVAAVAGDADAAAHDEAVHQRHIGLGVAGDPGVHPVLVGPEPARPGEVAAAAAGIDVGDIPAGAERPLAFGVDQHERDGGVVRPGLQRGVDGARPSRA